MNDRNNVGTIIDGNTTLNRRNDAFCDIFSIFAFVSR